ncbi:MAG: hypothetical protein LR011_00065, partial [Verrucomicrobia bacterium]|nr:hypothetical protein [Verrucomicrobiota bacterium]
CCGASAVVDLINGVGAFLANNQLAEARTTFNLALCKLVEEAAPLEKFQIRKNSILSFVTLHAGRVHRSIKSTMVTPLLVKFVPDESGEPGKGEWVTQPLILVDNLIGEGLEKGMTEKEFPPGEAPPAGKPKEHEVFMHIPELPDGQKAYVVVQVTRNLCNDDGSLAPPLRENYFIGVVQ